MEPRPTAPRLELRNIWKAFGPTVALAGLDLRVEPGEAHALVGQNGSGKSTLVKIIAGLYSAGRGSQMLIDATEVRMPARPRALRAAGLSFVHQDLGLVDDKSVAENICVGRFDKNRHTQRIRWSRVHAEARSILDFIEADIDSAAPVGALGPADRSKVAIARACSVQGNGRGMIVLDEPSRALPPDALEEFHLAIAKLRASGTGVLLISHNLEEVLSVADKISVLRDGHLVASELRPTETSEKNLASLMLGHQTRRAVRTAPAVASAAGRHAVASTTIVGLRTSDVSFPALEVAHGEVLGVTGLAGEPWEKLPYLIAGSHRAIAGTLRLGERQIDLSNLTPRRAVVSGVALVPEERNVSGLAARRTVFENAALPWLSKRTAPERGRRRLASRIHEHLAQLDVRPANPGMLISQLSGGNQQKVLVAKWLAARPQLLLLHEPTQAVDVGARETILRQIRLEANRGAAVLFFSVQPTDLAEVCDRVLTFRDGAFATIRELSPDAILDAVYSPQDLSEPTKER